MTAAPTEADLQKLHSLISELEEIGRQNQLAEMYEKPLSDGGCAGAPYDWQVNWHQMGQRCDQRGMICANRTGKTRTAAAEVAIHTTGVYPKWWKGHRLHVANDWIVCGITNESVRDIQQKALIGRIDENRMSDGSGWIPRLSIKKVHFRQSNVANVVDYVEIKHKSGQISHIWFKSYEQGAAKMQGVAMDGVWMDEEPESQQDEIFSELQTRLVDKSGILLFTRTPLLGLTTMVQHFMDGGEGIYYATATWDGSPHITAAVREVVGSRYLEHERATRITGVPMMGSGMVYDVPDEVLLCKPFPLASHYRRICGVDFGIDHPAAGAWLAHDADSDVVWLFDCYRQSNWTAAQNAHTIRSRGAWIPVAWPHDGMIRDKGGGVALKDQYEEHDVNMLHTSARYRDDTGGGQAREPATIDLLERMRTDRFKVFDTPQCRMFLNEIRMLHRKQQGNQGPKIHAVNDDIESAVRYGLMMLRFAVSEVEATTERPARDTESELYDPLAF